MLSVNMKFPSISFGIADRREISGENSTRPTLMNKHAIFLTSISLALSSHIFLSKAFKNWADCIIFFTVTFTMQQQQQAKENAKKSLKKCLIHFISAASGN